MSQYGIQIAEGQWNDTKSIFKFGYNGTVGTDEEAIWTEGGAYSYLSSATTLKISSASTADASAGTGARTVSISGLDADYNEISETVTLNGQTAVNTTNEYLRVFRMQVLTAGSGGANAGKVYAGTGTVTSGVPANKYAVIDAGENQTLMALWTVPAGYTAYIHQLNVSQGATTANKYATIRLKIRNEGAVFATKLKFDVMQQTYGSQYMIPIVVAEKSDIEVTGDSQSGDNTVSAEILMIYKKN